VDVDDYLIALTEHGRALAAAADRAGLDADVPTCPGWTVRDLVAHTNMVHRWAGESVRSALAAPPPDPEQRRGDDAVERYLAGHAELVGALRDAPDDLDCWTFLADAASPRRFWARRQAHETAMHRVDAEAALGARPSFAAEFAADGIAELLEGFYARPRGRLVSDPPVTLTVAPRDVDERWHVTIGPDRRTVVRGDAAADCELRGSAADLYLFLWNRSSDGVTVDGSESVVALWREKARVSW